MREKDVPQDPSFYRGHERACYAVGQDDRYVLAKSRGFEVERLATEGALLALEAEVEEARRRVLAGELAPLAYHLATHQMTPKLFARHVGASAWRIRRHLRPAAFARLPEDVLRRYAHALALDVAELARVPAEPTRVFLGGADA